MRNQPGRPVTLEIGVFGQGWLWIISKWKMGKRMSLLRVRRSAVFFQMEQWETSPSRHKSQDSLIDGSVTCPNVTDEGTHLSPITTVLTLCCMCRHKDKWTKKSDKDIEEKLKITGTAMSILELGLRISFEGCPGGYCHLEIVIQKRKNYWRTGHRIWCQPSFLFIWSCARWFGLTVMKCKVLSSWCPLV